MINTVKHPIIISDVNQLAGLIIRQTHFNTLHGVHLVMMAQIRSDNWIKNLRRACKMPVRRRLECIRYKKQAMDQLMGSIPKHGGRLREPFEVRPAGLRSRVRLKSWIAVFKCTKVIHRQLVDDLSSRAFVNAPSSHRAQSGQRNLLH